VSVAVVLALAYALGTLPTALVVGRNAGFDPTRAGSGNPGTSNVFRLGGRRAGATVLAGDLGKGIVATVMGLAVGGRPLALAAGVAAVLGHVLPLNRPRRGGKGVATALGVVVVLEPWLAVAAVVMWVAVVAVTRTAAAASLAMMAMVVAGVALAGRPAWEVAGVSVVAFLVAVRHRGNLTRLVWGRRGSAVAPLR
jgi:glycerol-3-phosphate acyltransferase PlsY